MAQFDANINLDVNAGKALAGINKVERAIDRLGKNAFLELKIKDNVSSLSSRVSKLRASLNNFNSSSDTAVKIAGKLVDVNARLNDELREQADLLRRIAGVNVTELEASKGRNSIQTRKRRDTFLEQQQRDIDAVQESLRSLAEAQAEVSNARLNERAQQFVDRENQAREETLKLEQALLELGNRRTTPLQEVLQVERRITNEKALQAQAERDRQFQGQSTRIPTPYRTAGSMGFPVALPEIGQDRKSRERQAVRESAERLLNLQKSNSLLVQGVTSLKAQVAIAEQLDGVYDQIVRSLQRANDRQSKLFRARENRQKRQELGGENLQRLQQVNKLATNRVLKEQLKNKVMLIGNAIRKNEFTTAKALGKEVDDLLKAEDARIDRARRLLAFRKKERQETRRNAQAAKRRNKAIGRGALEGFGFPLLFGAGPGATLGGGLGGIFGGATGLGFGAQAAGGALGTIIDNFNEGLQELSGNLNSATGILEGLSAASIQVSDDLTEAVKLLEEQGKFSEAYNIAVAKLQESFGPTAIEELSNYEAANTALEKEFSNAAATLQRELLPALTLLTNAFAGIIGLINNSKGFLEDLAKRAADQARPGFGTAISLTQAALRNVTSSPTNAFGVRGKGGTIVANQKEDLAAAEKAAKLEKERIAYEQQREIQRRRAAQELIQIENQRNSLVAERARIEADSLRYQLQVQSQIRNLELARKTQTISGQISLDRLSAQLGEAGLAAAQTPGSVIKQPEILERLFSYINLGNQKKVDDFAAGLEKIFAISPETISKQRIDELVTAYRKYVDILGQARQESFKTFEQQQQENLNEVETSLQRQVDLKNAVTDADRARLNTLFAIQDIEKRFPNATEEQLSKIKELITELNKLQTQSPLQQYIKQTTEALADTESQLLRVVQIFENQLASGITNFVTSMVDGSKTAAEAFADMLTSMGNALVQESARMIAQYIAIGIARLFATGSSPSGGGLFSSPSSFDATSIFSGAAIPFRASGGPVSSDRPYLVGERGPELFVPGSSGTVISNNQTQDIMSRYQGNTGAGSGSRTIRFESTVINNVEYVTIEQAMAMSRQAADDGAKRGAASGHARSMNTLKNSRSQRSRIGMR